MSEPINMHGMTFAEAQSFLKSLDYRHTMTMPEIHKIADSLSGTDLNRFLLALDVASAAYMNEAQLAEAEIAKRKESGGAT